VTGDEQVIAADAIAPTLERIANISRVVSSRLVERQHLEARRKPLDFGSVVLRARGFRGAMQELGKDNR
jgi:hypothetical protein